MGLCPSRSSSSTPFQCGCHSCRWNCAPMPPLVVILHFFLAHTAPNGWFARCMHIHTHPAPAVQLPTPQADLYRIGTTTNTPSPVSAELSRVQVVRDAPRWRPTGMCRSESGVRVHAMFGSGGLACILPASGGRLGRLGRLSSCQCQWLVLALSSKFPGRGCRQDRRRRLRVSAAAAPGGLVLLVPHLRVGQCAAFSHCDESAFAPWFAQRGKPRSGAPGG
jgi:hypothetical protein